MAFTEFPIPTVPFSLPMIDVTLAPYSAVADGTTDCTSAVQAAIDAAVAGGLKIIYFPPPADPADFYAFSGQLDLSSTEGITLLGDGNRLEPVQDTPNTALVYTGTSSPFIDGGGSRGLTIKGLAIQTNNASFTGDLVSLDFSGTPKVTYSTAFEDCMFGGRTGTACNAQSCLNLTGAVEAFVQRCTFGYSDYNIVAVPSGSSTLLSNAVYLTENRFNQYGVWAISAYLATHWSIVRNVFEPKNGTTEAAGITDVIVGSTERGGTHGWNIQGNGFWDTASGTWIDVQPFGLNVSSNYFDLGSAATGMKFRGGSNTRAHVSANRATGSAGSKFIDFQISAVEVLLEDGTSVVDSNVERIAQDTFYSGPSFRMTDLDAATVTVTGEALTTDGKVHVRRTAGSGAVGGTVVIDRADSTNWRGAALFSYFDATLSKDTLAIGLSDDTTAPDTSGKIVVKIDTDGGISQPAGRLMGFKSAAADPSATQFPNSGDWGVHKNTSSGSVFLAYNDGGSIKKVQLT